MTSRHDSWVSTQQGGVQEQTYYSLTSGSTTTRPPALPGTEANSSWWNDTNWFRDDEPQTLETYLPPHAKETSNNQVVGGANVFNRFASPRRATHDDDAQSQTTTPTRLEPNTERSRVADQLSTIGCAPALVSQLLEAVILPLYQRNAFAALGIRPNSGTILYGPMGCGKTKVLAAIQEGVRCYVQRLDCGMINALTTPPVGDTASKATSIPCTTHGEQLLRTAFTACRNNAPSLLILDDLDAIAHQPSSQGSTATRQGSSSHSVKLCNVLRAELDFMARCGANIAVVAAATNLAELNPSLLRVGRFSRTVPLRKPTRDGRLQILKYLTKDTQLAPAIDLDRIADRTEGFAGVDLAKLCQTAGMLCVRAQLQQHSDISMTDAWDVPLHDVPEDPMPGMATWRLQPEHFDHALLECLPESLYMAGVVRGMDLSSDSGTGRQTFADVGGQQVAKDRLHQSIQAPIAYPHVFARFGIKPSSGVLLYGPPGCGKTTLAKAVAEECGVRFLPVRGPELLSSYLGDSERRVRELFKLALDNAPCVVYFDELDALAPKRATGASAASMDRIVTQLLCEMDAIHYAFKKSSAATAQGHNSPFPAVFVIASTNRPEAIDPALLRPGRFDDLLYVGLPTSDARREILQRKLSQTVHVDPAVTDAFVESLVARSHGMTGADVVALYDTAARRAIATEIASGSPSALTVADFEAALLTTRTSVAAEELGRYEQFQSGMDRAQQQQGPPGMGVQGNVLNAPLARKALQKIADAIQGTPAQGAITAMQ